jgi:hypothetical protein
MPGIAGELPDLEVAFVEVRTADTDDGIRHLTTGEQRGSRLSWILKQHEHLIVSIVQEVQAPGLSYFEPRSLASDARARFRIMDSKETRGTLISLRISAVRSRRWVALGMREAARSKAPDDAWYMPAMARLKQRA